MSLGLDVNPINEGYYHKYLAADKEELEPIKQNPIYTQKMCDNGELPPIGSMFIDIELDNEEQVEAMAHDLEFGRVIYKRGSTLQDSEYFGAQAHECKPIPPKLELIDGKAYQFDCSKSVKVKVEFRSRNRRHFCVLTIGGVVDPIPNLHPKRNKVDSRINQLE